MQRQLVGVAIGALFVGLAAGNVFGRQSAEAEVRAMHGVYYQYFADGRADVIADEIYHPNRMRFGPDGVTISTVGMMLKKDSGTRLMAWSPRGTVIRRFQTRMSAHRTPGLSSSAVRSRATSRMGASWARWARPISTVRLLTDGESTPRSGTTPRRRSGVSSNWRVMTTLPTRTDAGGIR